MKTFPGFDETLCDNVSCRKKGTCKRHLTWVRAVEELYPYPLTLIAGEGGCDECDMYSPVDKEGGQTDE